MLFVKTQTAFGVVWPKLLSSSPSRFVSYWLLLVSRSELVFFVFCATEYLFN